MLYAVCAEYFTDEMLQILNLIFDWGLWQSGNLARPANYIKRKLTDLLWIQYALEKMIRFQKKKKKVTKIFKFVLLSVTSATLHCFKFGTYISDSVILLLLMKAFTWYWNSSKKGKSSQTLYPPKNRNRLKSDFTKNKLLRRTLITN